MSTINELSVKSTVSDLPGCKHEINKKYNDSECKIILNKKIKMRCEELNTEKPSLKVLLGNNEYEN
jgi:hypothetical protein